MILSGVSRPPPRNGLSRVCQKPRHVRDVVPAQAGLVPGFTARCRRGRVLPARAGLARRMAGCPGWCGCSPRASGAGPPGPGVRDRSTQFSQRERGWSPAGGFPVHIQRVLPARAGLVRTRGGPGAPCCRSPRASGAGPCIDDSPPWVDGFSPRERAGPAELAAKLQIALFSPRERGWSQVEFGHVTVLSVVPARAGLLRAPTPIRRLAICLPRASGAGPSWLLAAPGLVLVLPARAGLVRGQSYSVTRSRVLPAQAGLVPCTTIATT